MNPNFSKFSRLISNPIAFKFFLLKKLPAAAFCGLKINHFSETTCKVQIKYSWFSQNPFRSIYFAVEAMAAEMCSGMLVFGNVYKRTPAVSMLVVRMESSFYKKATGRILFSCEEGIVIQENINKAIQSGEGHTFVTTSNGWNEANEKVAEFNITWSVKAKVK
jgi:hypothetical protein